MSDTDPENPLNDSRTVPGSNERYYRKLSVLDGKYILDRELGRGGMGVVWLATEVR